MTWRELFRRAWLVLRLRRQVFRLCMDCGVPLIATPEKIEYSRCDECYELDCLKLREEMERRTRERQEAAIHAGLRPHEWDAELANSGYLRLLALVNSRGGVINPALLQNQIGAPIRVSSPTSMIGFLGSAIGSAIGGVIGHNPLP